MKRSSWTWAGTMLVAFAIGYWAHRTPSVSRIGAVRTQPIVKRLSERVTTAMVKDASTMPEALAPGRPHVWVPLARFQPRAEGEWQGMLVDVAVRPPCESTQSCQLSLACVEGTCGPCQVDSDCAGGESCVLDHCLLQNRAACTRARDCQEGELCMILSEGSDALRDIRGNLFLSSSCTSDGRVPVRPQPLGEEPEVYHAPDPPALLGPAPNVAIEHLQSSFATIEEGT